MTLEILEARVSEARGEANNLASRCEKLVALGELAAALAVCREASIDPPQCSLTAASENAHRLREAAARKLGDPKWWGKALEDKAIRSYEAEQMAAGKVTNYVSDGLFAYHEKYKSKR